MLAMDDTEVFGPRELVALDAVGANHGPMIGWSTRRARLIANNQNSNFSLFKTHAV